MKSLVSRAGSMLLALFAAAPAASAPGAVVAPIASESFAYGNFLALTGLSGGTGWTSAWQSDSPAFGDFRTNTVGLTYPGLAVSGGRIVWFSGVINDAVRTLPLVNSGVVYIQFLAQFGSQSGGGTPNFRLSDGVTLTGAIGGNGGCVGTVYSILDNGLNPQAGGASCSTAPLGTLSLVLVQIDYDNPGTKMWVDPNLATFDYLNLPAPQAAYAGLAPAFDRIAIYSRSPGTIDELSVFRVSAPAGPQSIPGLSLAGTLLLTAGVLAAARMAQARR
jgi:hypothetical protein